MKRSILFGILAMFAVSAVSVQNLNAQNDKVVKPAQQSINGGKPKQVVNSSEQATTKDKDGKVITDTKVTNNPQASDNSQEPKMRNVMNPQGQKESSVKKTIKNSDSGEKTTGKSTLKKSRPKKVSKNEKMKDETQSGVQKPNQTQQGNDNKPTLQKDEPKPQPNNVVRPRQKVKEGTASGNNNGTK